MKKKLFCIFCCFFFFTHSSVPQANANTLSVLKEILDWTVGDKLMEKCVDWLGCDGYEQPSVGDTLSGLVSNSNYKSRVCAVSGLLYNGGKIAGFLLGGFLGMGIGNNIGQALECLYVWMKSGSAKKKAEKYHICLDERDQGHPLPYTDRQIAKLLDLMNKFPTVENIVNSYDKLCIRDNYGHYDFLPRGFIFDDIIVDHAPGYIYVLCASIYSACPCIYNLQHGTLEEPDYIKDENGVIVMENGELQMRNKETYQKRYAKHCRVLRFRDLYEQTNDLPNIFHFSCNDMVGYSKGKLPITAPIVQCIEGTARNIFEMPILGTTHITTYKENTLDFYKNDYTLVNDIVTGIENVMGGLDPSTIPPGSPPGTPPEPRRNQTRINNKEVRDFTIAERIKIYHYLKNLWTQKNAVKTEYNVDASRNCINKGYRKYAFTQSNVTFLEKYFGTPGNPHATPPIPPTNPSIRPMMFCCEADFQTKVDNTSAYSCTASGCPDPNKHDYSGITLCERDDDITTDNKNPSPKQGHKFVDYFNGTLSRTFDLEDSHIDATSFPTTDIFEYYEEAKEFRDGLKEKYQTISKIYNAVDGTEFQEKNFKLEYTLFDIFRNRIKAVAGIFLVLWLFLIGWKFINGDTKLLKLDEFLKMLVKMALCWLIVFDDGAKNQLFRLVMQVAQGSVTAVDSVFSTIRNKQNNLVEKACSFGNDVGYSPTVEHVSVTSADAIPNAATGLCSVNVTACDERLTTSTTNLNETKYPGLCYGVVKGGRCEYYALTCQLRAGTYETNAFHCERHLVRDGKVTEVCLQGHCDANSVDFIPVPPFSRPYKYYVRKDKTATGGYTELKPKCCNDTSVGNKCEGEEAPSMIYSQALNQPVYVCRSGKKMSAGYKLADLIAAGIIENEEQEMRPFFQLYNEQMNPSPLKKKGDPVPSDITDLIIPTSVADIDMNGRIVDLDFVDANQGTELYGRFQYAKYLVSKVNAANANSNYPNIVENGFWHNYAHIGFWDKIDCKIIQYLTFSMSGNGLDKTLTDAVEHMKTPDNTDALVTDLLNGLLQVAKFLVIAFPFGVMAFCLFFALGVVMFMMLARATQKYCVCIFNLVLTIYLSPVVFIMYLFDATSGAMQTFRDDLKANITGSITPFITLSLFLFVLDWLMFGDEKNYIPKHMFSGDGVDSTCYDGEESDAPIACLTRKLLDRFRLVAFFQMFIGRGPMVEGITYKMMWFLLMKLFVALTVFMIMMSICDVIENSIQSMIGEAPDTKLGVGFEGSAKDAYGAGIDAFSKSVSTVGSIYKGVGKGIYNVAKSIFGLGSGTSDGGSGGNSLSDYLQGYEKGWLDGAGSVGREGVGNGLNAVGTNGTNMNNAFSKGGMQGGQGEGLSNISSQFSSMFGQGGNKSSQSALSSNSSSKSTSMLGQGKTQSGQGAQGVGLSNIASQLSSMYEKGNNPMNRSGTQSDITENSMKSGRQSDFAQGYEKGFLDGSGRSGGTGGDKTSNDQQGWTDSVKELFNNKSTKSTGEKWANFGKATVNGLGEVANGAIKGVNNAANGVLKYCQFVSNNIRQLNQPAGPHNNQSVNSSEEYGVQNSLLDDIRANNVQSYEQNRGANRPGVPKDVNNDSRNDTSKKNTWSVFSGMLTPFFGSNATSGSAGNAMGAPAKYENNMSNMNSDISNISKTQHITQQTNTSKETQVTNDTIKEKDRVNVKETRVYAKGNNNGNKNNNDN